MEAKKVYTNNQTSLAVRKSNSFISAIYSLDAISAKIFSICLTHVQIKDGAPVSSVSATEFKELLGKTDTNIYTKLKTASKKLLDPKILIENEDGSWIAFNMVSTVSYKNSVFNMEMSRELTPHVSDLLGSYTTYEVEQIIPLSKYSIRLYEKLKSDAWRANKKSPMVIVEYDLSELKFELGAIEMNPQEIQEYRKKGYSWKEIEDRITDGSMIRWNNFKARVLDKAKKEFEENHTDLGFDYVPVRIGSGGPVRRVRFNIWNNNPQKVSIPDSLKVYVGHNKLTEKDIENFLLDADKDEEAIIRAIEKADEQSFIKNYVGWIRTCIKEGFAEPVETLSGSAEKADRINAFMEDYEEAKKDENGPMYQNAWNKIKSRSDHFQRFVDSLALPLDMYEEYNTAKERVDEYIEWSKGKR